MSEIYIHEKCPAGAGGSWWHRRATCRQAPLYIRESFEVENPARIYRRRQTKRKWKRVGLLCLGCGAVDIDAGIPSDVMGPTTTAAAETVGPAGPSSVDQRDRDGLPGAGVR